MMNVKVLQHGDKTVWMPIATSKNGKGDIRILWPFKGLEGSYTYAKTTENRRESGTKANFLTALKLMQIEFNKVQNDKDYSVNIGIRKDSSLLSASAGWVEIEESLLRTMNESDILKVIAQLKGDPDAIVFGKKNEKHFYPIKSTQRAFQNTFKKNVLLEHGHVCQMSGVTVALNVCHIKTVATCKDEKDYLGYIDPMNGLILQVTLHVLFDDGYFSFMDNGEIIYSSKFTINDRERLGLDNSIKINFKPEALKYLSYHRSKFFPLLTKHAA